MRFPESLLAAALLVMLTGACQDIPEDIDPWEPKGIMRGTVTYFGPLPCSENGHVVGNAVITFFNVNALPPPAGLGLAAHRIAVVPGDVLFAGVAHKIPAEPGGLRACPAPNAAPVQASASWEVGPVDPGRYQTRAWFDYDGDWHAAFKFSNMMTKGDISGGSVDNVGVAIAGGTPQFTNFEVGVRGDDGVYRIPEKGYVLDNMVVLLAVPVPTNRPYFHLTEFRHGKPTDAEAPVTIPNPSDADIVMPSDYRMFDARPERVHDYMVRFTIAAGLPADEVGPATASPFYFRLDEPPNLLVARYDADKDGDIDDNDHIAGTVHAVKALGPIVSLAKLDVENDAKQLWRSTQAVPRVFTSLIVTPPELTTVLGLWREIGCTASKPLCQANPKAESYGKCCDADGTSCDPAINCYSREVDGVRRPVMVPKPSIFAFARPSVVCIKDSMDRSSRTIIVTPHEFDQLGGPTLGDTNAIKRDVALQLGRDLPGVEIAYGCLPPGRFAINLTYPMTGQAWTLPNESGICMPGEQPGENVCGQRKKLASQFRTFQIGPATDPVFCNSQRKPLTDPDPIRDHCLTPKEREAYTNGTLWGGGPSPL